MFVWNMVLIVGTASLQANQEPNKSKQVEKARSASQEGVNHRPSVYTWPWNC